MTASAGPSWRHLLGPGGVAALALLTAAPSLAAQRVEWSEQLSASRGSYIFTDPTTTWTLTTGFTLAAERWRLGATLPLTWQNSLAITRVAGMQVPTGGPDAGAVGGRTGGQRVRMQGSGGTVTAPGTFMMNLADPVFDAATEIHLSPDGRSRVGVEALVKLPVASVESGIGTGQFDYGAGASLSLAGPRSFLFASVTHWVLGDLPDLELRDVTGGAIGAGLAFGELGRWSVMASGSGSSAVIAGVDAPLSAGIGVGLALGTRRFLNAALAVGLSESAPDWSLSAGWRTGMRER